MLRSKTPVDLSLALVLASAALLFPLTASADVLDCEDLTDGWSQEWGGGEGGTRASHELPNGDILTIEMCQAFAGHAYYDTHYAVKIRREDELVHEQTLTTSMSLGASSFEVAPGARAVTITMGCGDAYSEKASEQNKTCTTRYTWSDELERFLHPRFNKARRQYRRALSRGDLDKAEALYHSELTRHQDPGPGCDWSWTAPLALDHVRALHARALSAHRRGDKARARDIAAKLGSGISQRSCAEPGALFASPLPGDEVLFLPDTDESIRLINDLAFFLDHDPTSAQRDQAIATYRAIITARPSRAAAHLNLADALWARAEASRSTDSESRAAARQRYCAYRDLKQASSKTRPLPERVLERTIGTRCEAP